MTHETTTYIASKDAHSESSLPDFIEDISFSEEQPQALRLLPVQHLILDVLEEDIPLKLLSVSKPVYNQNIPTIYKRVNLTNDNIVPFFQGLNIHKKQNRNGKTIPLGERISKVLSMLRALHSSIDATKPWEGGHAEWRFQGVIGNMLN